MTAFHMRAARHNALVRANVLSWRTKFKLMKYNICNKVTEWQNKRQHKVGAYNPVQRDNIKGCFAAFNTDCHRDAFPLVNPTVYNRWIDSQRKLCAKMKTWCFKGTEKCQSQQRVVNLKPKDVAPLRWDTRVCVRRHFLLMEDLKKKEKSIGELGGSHTVERKFKTCWEGAHSHWRRENKADLLINAFKFIHF